MIYYTIVKLPNEGYIIDSVSEDLNIMRNKFPNEIIYESDIPIMSIYINSNELKEAN